MSDLIDETPERPIRALRRKRLQALLREFGGPKALAEMADTVDTHLTTMEKGRRDIGDALATKLEAAAGKPFGWMDGAVSDEALRFAQIFDRLTEPETRDAVLTRLLQIVAREFPDAAPAASEQRSPTNKRPAHS